VANELELLWIASCHSDDLFRDRLGHETDMEEIEIDRDRYSW